LGDIQADGYTVVTVSDNDRERITSEDVTTFDDYVVDFQESFEFKFVEEEDLNSKEKAVFDMTEQILGLVGGRSNRPQVCISETMRGESDSSSGGLVLHDAIGCYNPGLNRIVIKRSELASLSSYAAVLLHEAAHASSGAKDATRLFENELTSYLGKTAESALDSE